MMIDDDVLITKINALVPYLVERKASDVWDPVLDDVIPVLEVRALICDFYGLENIKEKFKVKGRIFPTDFESYYKITK